MKLLLTGASGFLGLHIEQAAGQHDIHGWYNRQPPRQPLQQASQVNLCVESEVEQAFVKAAPQVVLHCAAISSIAIAEREPEQSQRVNVDASAQLARLCSQSGIPFVFCSTDMVFDGVRGNYSETDAVNPLNIYGKQKAMAETAVLEACPYALILRLPLLLGYVPGSAAGTIAGLIESNSRGETVQLFTNEYRSVAWAANAAEAMIRAVEENWQGIYHLGGPQPLSRYETGMLVKEYYKLHRLQIQAVTHKQAGAAGRPANATLDSKKAQAKGYNPHTVRQALEILRRS
jgi:dTDP-4-dehydrorhamnose reductase